MSGITELCKYFHPPDVGTCVGSGMGGTESLVKMFKDRHKEKDLQNDILQETSVHHFTGGQV
jgi:fatty acid synthase subunit alpha, fungi type